jgi:hypothetical protein
MEAFAAPLEGHFLFMNWRPRIRTALMIFLVERCHGQLQVFKNVEKVEHAHQLERLQEKSAFLLYLIR